MSDVTRTRPARRKVVGTFVGLDEARHGIEALQRAGFDGGAIGLAGETARRAGQDTERARPDRRAVGYVSRRLGAGVVVGTLAGLVVGAVVAAVILLVTDTTAGRGSAVGALIMGAFLGGTWAALVNVYRSVGQDADPWQATFHHVGDGPVGVTAACARPDDVERAERALRDAGSSDVAVVDEDGHLDP
jgi:hypothetical protein